MFGFNHGGCIKLKSGGIPEKKGMKTYLSLVRAEPFNIQNLSIPPQTWQYSCGDRWAFGVSWLRSLEAKMKLLNRDMVRLLRYLICFTV